MVQLIEDLQNTQIKEVINERLKEFQAFKNKSNDDWFSELCFCILTANSKAKSAMAIQDELKADGFINAPEKKVKEVIKKHKHRFHNNKTNYIILARENKNIKDILKKELEPRDFIIKNIKGIGYKEASHFLRNVGYTDYAILDRHILRFLKQQNYINEIPTLTKKNYLQIEKIFKNMAQQLKMTASELDLYVWFHMTGKVLK